MNNFCYNLINILVKIVINTCSSKLTMSKELKILLNNNLKKINVIKFYINLNCFLLLKMLIFKLDSHKIYLL